jgi:hypothetical protein
MEIREFAEKVETIRQYRASKDLNKKAKLMSGANSPIGVELLFESSTTTFTLSANETFSLFSEFPDIREINDLFL